jgi:rare lipoprotein A (peptidoglycan hydrolase)
MRARVLPFVLAAAALVAVPVAAPTAAADPSPWQVSGATYYGPGLYGNRTACGQTLTPDLVGVAHRSLPCGTQVEFEWHGRTVVAPVVDRGPYGSSAIQWDLTEAACRQLSSPGDSRCFTHEIAWRTL